MSHPIQYCGAWFRHLAQRLDIEVFYAHRQRPADQGAAGFGVELDWDVPLLQGYRYRWLTNIARRPSVQTFAGCDTPELAELIRPERFDAFLVFGWNRKCSIQAALACWRHRVPILMRGDSQLATPRSPLTMAAKYLPYRWALPRLNGHLYVGQRNKEYLQYYGVPDARLFPVPHVVDNTFFATGARHADHDRKTAAIRAAFGIPPGAFIFLFVGKLIEKKRPADLARACCRVVQQPEGANTYALVVGDGPLRSSLESLVTPSPRRIHFAGFRNQSELPAFYRAANALVLPSDARETWGLVVNEAAACGIPAVVSDAVGCAPDLIDEGRTGYTYPLGDIDALAHQMLAAKRLCETQREAVRVALGEKIGRHSFAVATDGVERALASVCERSPRSGVREARR